MFTRYVGIFIIASSTLLLELTLIRVFDVILYNNLAYMVITCALFGFGLAGVYATLRPVKNSQESEKYIIKFALLFGISTVLILPAMNIIPFNFLNFAKRPLLQFLSFSAMYVFLILPFFFSGLIFVSIFSTYAGKIQSIYFWDLSGAAAGCLLITPLIPITGPGGLLFVIFGLCIIAGGLFSNNRKKIIISVAAGVLISSISLLGENYFLFREHQDKRGVIKARKEGRIEFSIWDPVSKIEVINNQKYKHVVYDGGSQSSRIYPFDGDLKKLRSVLPDSVNKHFWSSGVIASHYLKRDQNQKVLIIGSAAGQEVKASLTYGASKIDGVEMVRAVVNICYKDYAVYNGRIFHDPKVHIYIDEGRRFLSGSSEKYDIIQIFSNHTTSSLAMGSGALATNYLLTSEAFVEYFKHLNKDGILHINHHIYPKIITTAALAWNNLQRTEFQKHVAVFERTPGQDNLPTILIKMSPWNKDELNQLDILFSDSTNSDFHYALVENPLNYEESFLSEDFYKGNITQRLLENVPFRVEALTDDKPFFSFMRKEFRNVQPDKKIFVNESTALLLNEMMAGGIIPLDIIHVIIPGIISLLAAFLFIVIPLKHSSIGKSSSWPGKNLILIYFSCLGAGFIILELIFIQICAKLIGHPLYNYSTVLFVLLFAAGSGSMISERWKIMEGRKWIIPFAGIIIFGSMILYIHQPVFELFLSSGLMLRMFVVTILLFPLGFFLGMPFPLGILHIQKDPKGAVAWAWGMNGLFTVIGSLLSVIISAIFGFKITIISALLIYLLALIVFYSLKRKSTEFKIKETEVAVK